MDQSLADVLLAPPPVLRRQQSLDALQAAQQDELEALEAIFEDAFTVLCEGVYCVHVRAREEDPEWAMSLRITFCFTETYPQCPPVFQLASEGALSWAAEDELYNSLLQSAMVKMGDAMMFDLALETQDHLEQVVAQRKADAQARAQRQRRQQRPVAVVEAKVDDESEARAEAGEARGQPASEAAVRLSWLARFGGTTRQYTPGMFVRNFAQLFRQVQQLGTVTHCENVLRHDLAQRFLDCAAATETPPEEWVQGFHGTGSEVVGSIVSKGLLVPGSFGVGVANGSAMGNGIYVSTEAAYSMSYCRGHEARMFICVAVLGERKKMHETCNNKQFVLFSSPQVLPCYVLHIRTRETAAAGEEQLTVTSSGSVARVRTSEDVLRSRAFSRLRHESAALQRGQFMFPGRQILAVGSDDDDDDETAYGEISELVDVNEGQYQAERTNCDPEVLAAVLDSAWLFAPDSS